MKHLLQVLLGRGLVAALTLSLSACDALSGDCVSIGRIAVRFTLRDHATNAVMTAGALATLAGRTFADTVVVPPGEARSTIGSERDGPVLLTVQAPGYLRWERTMTIRRSGHCDVLQSVTLDVLLQRASQSQSAYRPTGAAADREAMVGRTTAATPSPSALPEHGR